MISIKDFGKKKAPAKCAICSMNIVEKSPVADLCPNCFNKCVGLSVLLDYLQSTSVANLNAIHAAAGCGCSVAPLSESPVVESEPPAPEQSAYIIRKKTGDRIEIKLPEMTIGSSPETADYAMPENRTLSHLHAAICCESGKFYVADRGSKNGVRIDGRRLLPNEKAELSEGKEFFLANEEFVFIR